MSQPNPSQPEGKSSAAAGEPLAPQAAHETKRTTASVPVATGTFAKLPAKFGRYQVEKLLGRGAMGAVYLARDTQLERPVALKIPRVSGSGAANLLARLKTEAKAAARIDHPCVCHVHDSGEIDGVAFIVMQYVEGETLKERLAKQPLTPVAAVALVIHLAEGLAEAHAQGIYHRDLKPENIKLNRRGVPVIMDFGLAKLSATITADAGATQKGTILGSPAYMSPEQAGGKVEAIDHRSDIYSLGVILYEMLTGQWPFSGAAIQVMGQKSVLEPPSPLTIKPELNPQLAAVCQKMVAKERQQRFQTADEVIAALQSIDFGTPSGSGPAAAPVDPSFNDAVELPNFMADDESLPSLASRRRLEANRRAGVSRMAKMSGGLWRSVALWWHRLPRGTKWTSAVAGIVSLVGFVLWAGGVVTRVKVKEGTRETFKARLEPEAEPAQISIASEKLAEQLPRGDDETSTAPDNSVLDRIREIETQPHTPVKSNAPPDALAFQNKRFFIFTNARSWHEAKQKSLEMRGRLAEVRSQEENDFLAALGRAHNVEGIWLGATDEAQEGQWRWSDGSPVTYSNWGSAGNQPNNKGGVEHYLMLLTKVGQWCDQPATSLEFKKTGYVCEWNAEPGDSRPSTAAPVAAERDDGFRPPAAARAPAASEEKGFKPLFNGKNLSGWKTHRSQPGKWSVKQGVLVGSGPRISHLYSQRQNFSDFHLRVEARINDGGNSGVWFRSSASPEWPHDKPVWPLGFEAQINCASKDRFKTGSLLYIPGKALVDVPTSPVPPGKWFTLEVIAVGNQITVQVDGKTTADFTDNSQRSARGGIALQDLGPGSVVEYRKVEIKEIKR